MRTATLFSILFTGLLGCGGSNGELLDGDASASSSLATGDWSGTWASVSGVEGGESFRLSASQGDVTGTVSFDNSPCFASGSLSGTLIADDLTATITAGGIEATLTATITGDQMSGTYQLLSAGECTGDTGTFSATR